MIFSKLTRSLDIDSLYICYWSFNDPLCQTQSLEYIKQLAKSGYRFALITYEQPVYTIPANRRREIFESLAQEGIYWFPLKYHKRFPLISTIYDCLMGIIKGGGIIWMHNVRVVHARASIASFVALVLSKICGVKFLYDADSKLSEEYADIGHWMRDGLAYRVVSMVEKQSLIRSDSVIVLTQRLKRDVMAILGEAGYLAKIDVIPCCVNTDCFVYDKNARNRKRAELGLTSERLFVYVGKTGSWYQIEEMMRFFGMARALLKNAKLLILSPDGPEEYRSVAFGCGLSPDDFTVKAATQREVAEWLSAADVGLAFIASVPSKRGSSPIKVGEYLSAGLPVVITADIGDYSGLIQRHRLGVVIYSHDNKDYVSAVESLRGLWLEGDNLRMRCRRAAEEYLSLISVGISQYSRIYDELLHSNTIDRKQTASAP